MHSHSKWRGPDECNVAEVRFLKLDALDDTARGLLSAIAAEQHLHELALHLCHSSEDRRMACMMLRDARRLRMGA